MAKTPTPIKPAPKPEDTPGMLRHDKPWKKLHRPIHLGGFIQSGIIGGTFIVMFNEWNEGPPPTVVGYHLYYEDGITIGWWKEEVFNTWNEIRNRFIELVTLALSDHNFSGHLHDGDTFYGTEICCDECNPPKKKK